MAVNSATASQGTAPAPVPTEGEAAPAQETAPAPSAIPASTGGGDEAKIEIDRRAAQAKIDAGTEQVKTGETEKTIGMSAMSVGVGLLAAWPVGTIIGAVLIVGGAITYGVGCNESDNGHKKLKDGQTGMAGADAAAATVGSGAKTAIEASQDANKETPPATETPPSEGPKKAAADAAASNAANTSTPAASTTPPATTTAPASTPAPTASAPK